MQINARTKRFSKACFIAMICSLGSLSAIYVPPVESYNAKEYKEQSNSDPFIHEYGVDDRGHTIYYRCQDATENYLYLGPNEVFFSPVGTLGLGGRSGNDSEAAKFNKKRIYSHVKNFWRHGLFMEWPFITENKGGIRADVFLSEHEKVAGTVLEVQVDDQAPMEVTLTEETAASGLFSFYLPELENGFHMLRMGTKKTVLANFKLLNCRLTGEGVKGAQVVRERWRPEAVRARFSSSESPDDVQSWIMELSSDSQFTHYSPVSTDFGYFGPAFLAGGAVQNVNMSIWSYGKKEEPLPYNERSHLLGIGSSKGRFSEWSHEGYGVKVRGWNIFEDNISKKHVLGLRYKIDGKFVIYYGYFWNEVIEEWQLFSVGRKLNNKNLTDLKLKTFIEVTGDSARERSNQAERKVCYRGWVRNSNGDWTDVDQMYEANDLDYLSNKEKGISEDGETFYMKTGGLINQYPINQGMMQKEKILNRPLYMNPEKLQAFENLPFIPEITNVTLNDDGYMTVEFKSGSSLSSDVTLCWGPINAQTNTVLWENVEKFDLTVGDPDRINVIRVPQTVDPRFFRVLVQNNEAQMWNFDSFDLYPDMIDPEDARPFDPHIENVTFDAEGNMTISYIRGTKYPSKMIITWGSTDGGEDISSWENIYETTITGTKHRHKYSRIFEEIIPVSGDTSVFRIFISNEEGSVWSKEPYSPLS